MDSMSGFFVLANHELMRARRTHGPMHSHHEAYAVLLEELQEVWDEVRQQQPNPQRIIAELIQVAAMCARWAEDVCAPEESEARGADMTPNNEPPRCDLCGEPADVRMTTPDGAQHYLCWRHRIEAVHNIKGGRRVNAGCIGETAQDRRRDDETNR